MAGGEDQGIIIISWGRVSPTKSQKSAVLPLERFLKHSDEEAASQHSELASSSSSLGL